MTAIGIFGRIDAPVSRFKIGFACDIDREHVVRRIYKAIEKNKQQGSLFIEREIGTARGSETGKLLK